MQVLKSTLVLSSKGAFSQFYVPVSGFLQGNFHTFHASPLLLEEKGQLRQTRVAITKS